MTKNTNSVNGGALPRIDRTPLITGDRSQFIGGSDARIIMGKDERALHRLWREKRGEAAPPPDLSGVLIDQRRRHAYLVVASRQLADRRGV